MDVAISLLNEPPFYPFLDPSRNRIQVDLPPQYINRYMNPNL